MLVEGPRAAREALASGATVEFAVVTEEALREADIREWLEPLADAEERLVVVDAASFRTLVDTDAPQGVALVVAEPSEALEALLQGRLIVLDGVQDPGNAGTLLRTAWALGLDGAVALDGTVDVWNPKCVRASAGAGFHLPVARSPGEGFLEWAEAGELPLLTASGTGEDVRGVEVGGRWALLVGNEARGPRPELVGASEEAVSVPMPGGADSLNAAVAGSILLWELTLGRDR